MAGSILGRLIEKVGEAIAASVGVPDVLRSEFGFLDRVEPGLVAKTLGYIASGDGRPVLSILSAKSNEIEQVRRTAQQTLPGGSKLATVMWESNGQAARLARLVEVLTATSPQGHVHSYGWMATAKVPREVLVLCSNLRLHASKVDPAKRMTMTEVVEAVEMLGGSRADLIDASYTHRYSSLLTSFPDGPARLDAERVLLSADVAELREGMSRLDAAGREALLAGLFASHAATSGDVAGFLFSFCEDGSAKVRDQARKLLLLQDRSTVVPEAMERLGAGKTALRTCMVQLLGEIGGDEVKAALKARAEVEKTQSILVLIDQFTTEATTEEAVEIGSGPGYVAADGSWIAIPPLRALEDSSAAPFGASDIDELKRVEDEMFRRDEERQREREARGWKLSPVRRHDYAARLVSLFNGETSPGSGSKFTLRDVPEAYGPWVSRALQVAPEARALRLAVQGGHSLENLLHPRWESAPLAWIASAFEDGQLEVRHVLTAADAGKLTLNTRSHHVAQVHNPDGSLAERYLRQMIYGNSWDRGSEELPALALWPVVAENLGVIVDALPPKNLSAAANEAALRLLSALPMLPKALVQPVLLAAMSDARGPRTLAQALVARTPGVDADLVAMLGDSRQGIRANAAACLAQRDARNALPALIDRLKREKSEAARAAMIAAVSALGGDTEPYLGRAALEAEARALASKLKADSLEWLPLSSAPLLHWRGAAPVAPEVADGWIKLALKLRNPGERGLFGLYLDQLEPDDASALGDWILQSWIAYDSYLPAKSEALDKAIEQAKAVKANPIHSQYYAGKSIEEIAADLMRYQPVVYPNSGSDAKGVLALCQRATPTRQAKAIAAYLKVHGKRVSQAKSLLELLAASGSPEAVQVLVATATRFKQRTVREQAEALVQALAEARDWSADELADRSIPSGGLEDGGEMVLEVGEEAKLYRVRLGSDLALKIFNPEGREVKSLPAGTDENSKAAKEAFTAAKTAVKTVTAQQAKRLYEAMVTRRAWRLKDWRADLNDHPIMARLTERVVWRGLGAGGEALALFRPTPEGDLFDAAGDDASLDDVVSVEIAHGSLVDENAVAAWRQHLEDFEVAALFPQFARPVLRLDAAQGAASEIIDRRGWLMESLPFRSEASKRGYDKGPAEDGGWVHTYLKPFPSLGIGAEIEFTGHGQDGENIPVAIEALRFVKTTGRRGALDLTKVPPLLLSECWNDLHEIALKGAFDPEWQKKAGF